MTTMKKLATALTLSAVSAFALANAAHADEAPAVKLCTGAKLGNYEYSGQMIKRVASNLNIEVINTQGSWDNMQKLASGECDVATVQEDAVMAYKRTNNFSPVSVANLYQESLHLICNKAAKVDNLTDLMNTNKKLALGKSGSGPWVTWENIKAAEPRYSKVVTSPESGNIAWSQVEQGELDCALVISGVKSASLVKADADFGATTQMVTVRDGDVSSSSLKGMTGKTSLYSKTEIPGGTYKNWAPSGFFGGKTVETLSVTAKLVASPNLDDDVLSELIGATKKAMPAILDKVQPK